MPLYINEALRFFTRASAFLLKEILEITRQPLLLLTLVIGPFLILFFFGIGYRNEARALRTLFVVEQDSPIAQKLDEYATSLGPQLIFVGKTDDLEAAEEQLRQGNVDLVTVLPSNAYETILNNEQAVFTLRHNEIDPLQTNYVNVFGQVYVDEVNRRVLRLITSEGQLDVSKAQVRLDEAQASAKELSTLLQRCAEALADEGQTLRCDADNIIEYIQDLDDKINELNLIVGDDLSLGEALEQELGQEQELGDTGEEISSIERIIEDTDELKEQAEVIDDYLTQLQTLIELEADLAVVEDKLTEFLNIDPRILISPFRSEVSSIATVQLQVNDFFAPAVIILLLQHLILTFAALSMVRERQLGSMELFNVAPISAVETLLGKYFSYMLFGAVLAAILISLIVFGMGVPMLGNWFSVVLVVMGVLFTSLGIGFIISLISQTDTQAVQYSMIVLLTSVFFSGFILGLNTLWEPVRAISWSIPATYGILLLRNIMLRGAPLDINLFLGLVTAGVGLFLLAWWLLRRSMANV